MLKAGTIVKSFFVCVLCCVVDSLTCVVFCFLAQINISCFVLCAGWSIGCGVFIVILASLFCIFCWFCFCFVTYPSCPLLLDTMMIYMYCIVGRQLPTLTLHSAAHWLCTHSLTDWTSVVCYLLVYTAAVPSIHPSPFMATTTVAHCTTGVCLSCHDDAVIMSMITSKVLCCVYVVCVSLTESTWWYATEAIRAYTVMQYENNDACCWKLLGGPHHHHHWWSELTAACIKHSSPPPQHYKLILFVVVPCCLYRCRVCVCMCVCVSGYHQYCCNRMLTPSPSYRNINHTQLLVFHYLCLIEYVVTAHTLYTLHASSE